VPAAIPYGSTPIIRAPVAVEVSKNSQSALNKSNVLYGRDLLPVDGTVFEIKVGENKTLVGSACRTSDTNCVPIPNGVRNLVDLLGKLDKERLAKPTCNTTFAGGETLADCAPQKVPPDMYLRGRVYLRGRC
jgi:hypothetical protein